VIDYPSAAEEHRILASTTVDEEPMITPVATAAEIEALRHLVRDVPAASNVVEYALRIVRASRPAGDSADGAPQAVRPWGRGPAGGAGADSRCQGARAPRRSCGGGARRCPRGGAAGAAASHSRELSSRGGWRDGRAGDRRAARCREDALSEGRDHIARGEL